MQRRPYLLACLVSVGLLTAAYSNHFDNGFHFDDTHVIVNNAYIRDLGNIPRFFIDGSTFSTLPENAQYRPLLSASYALDYWLGGGLDPRPFHRTQFLLLLLLGALLVLFFKRLFDLAEALPANAYLALAAALLFCIHTANTETVNYISSRSNLLAALGVVGSFVLYQSWPRGRRWYLHALPMALGALAKPVAVMFGPLLFLYVLLLEERLDLRDLGGRAGWQAVQRALARCWPILALGGLLFLFVWAMNPDELVYAEGGRWRYLLSQPFVWLHYFRLFLLPLGLTADTDWQPVAHWYDTRVVAGLLFLAALGLVAILSSRRQRWRPVSFGLLWFAATLMPTSSILPLSELYNEHRIFLPFVGLSTAAGWLALLAWQTAATKLGRPVPRMARRAAALAVAALLLAHAAGTRERNRVWRNEESLWRDVVEKSPRNGRGLMNYGLTHMRHGRFQEALELYERARALTPNYPFLEVNLAIAKASLKRDEEAEAHFRRALEIHQDFAIGQYFFSRWLVEQGRALEAIPHLEAAMQRAPADLRIRSLLTRIYVAIGDDAGAEKTARGTLELVPGEPLALAYLSRGLPATVGGDSLEDLERQGLESINAAAWLDAAALYRRVLELSPESAAAWNNLGWARLKLGAYESAAPCFLEAYELDPTMEVALNNHRWTMDRLREQAGG